MKIYRKSINLKRVVITGIGIISPVGIGIEEPWESVKSGRSGITKITKFPVDGFNSKIAGEVKNFQAEKYLEPKEIRRLDIFLHYGIAAAKIAIDDSGIMDYNGLNNNRFGVIIGSGIGGIKFISDHQDKLRETGPRRIAPYFIPGAIINMASGIVSIKYNAKGYNSSPVTACATSTHAIGDAFRVIERGEADVMIAGGTEAPITPLGVGGFDVMRALSRRNDEPERASRPFDKERDGFVIAEGSTVLILESYEHAVKRGAKIYAEIIGYGASGDAYHQTAPPEDGEGAYNSMINALRDAGISPEEVEYINAHGTSTKLNDKTETFAIKRVFGESAKKLLVSSTKSMTGHMLGAAGAIEAAFTILALKDGIVPPTINYENPDPDCDLDYVPNEARERKIKIAMSNSFGFGGTNATLVFKKI